MESITAAFSTVFVLTICLLQSAHSKEEKVLQPCGGQQVCATLMKYKDGTVTDEGDYCQCQVGKCNRDWDEIDQTSKLSWQHYERAHWSVQYQFCRPVFQERPVCAPKEMGAQVETAHTEWAPYVKLPRCVCPDNAQYRITGWKRIGAVWQYYYDCDKVNCTAPSPDNSEPSTCAKIYVNQEKAQDKVLEMQFLCSCPEGFLCPAKYNDKEDRNSLERDAHGTFVAKECESVVKRKRSS